MNNEKSNGEEFVKIDFQKKEKEIMAEMKKIVKASAEKDLIIVSNIVGMGIVPAHEIGRGFRDIAGRVNQYLANEAKEVYLTVAGIPVELKEISKNIID